MGVLIKLGFLLISYIRVTENIEPDVAQELSPVASQAVPVYNQHVVDRFIGIAQSI